MNQLSIIASIENVVSILISIRLKEMRARHDRIFLHSVSSHAPAPCDVRVSGADKYLPPRRQWSKAPPDARAGLIHSKVTAQAIWRTIRLRIREDSLEDLAWGRLLLELVAEAQAIAAGKLLFQWNRPEVLTIPKDKASETYRVVAPCRTLLDRIMSGLLAKHLESIVEPSLKRCCYSFRVGDITHHDAIEDLLRFCERSSAKRLYVAECDLVGFYDSLAHEVAMAAVRAAATENGIRMDPIANQLLQSLLASYSFPGYAHPAARERLARNSRGGSVDWIGDEQKDAVYGDTPDTAIGVAQGNPVSPVLANIVLAYADDKVASVLGSEGFYARYCDDVIMMHGRKQILERGLNAYMEAMRDLRLPVHLPMSPKRYSAAHYGLKSKRPYRWGDHKQVRSAIPWIQFVGYQIHFTGALRIRRKSIDRHKDSVSDIVSRTIDLMRILNRQGDHPKISGRSIYWKVALRIVRAGVGDRKRRSGVRPLVEPCWFDAFPLVSDNPFIRHQMRELDRHREIQLRRLRRFLKKEGWWEETVPETTIADSKSGPAAYFGAPFSYAGTLANNRARPRRFSGSAYNS